MKKLAMSFVTYNREKHIKENLALIAQPTKECGVDIYIYDGSTNRNTEQVVKQYVEKGYNHIHYFHTDEKLSETDSFLQRINSALSVPDTEYIWMSGDKNVISPEFYPEILSYIDKSYDIITIYGRPLKGTREFDRPEEYVDYAIVPITHWGSTIIKRKLIESFDISKGAKECPSFSVQLAYLRGIADIEEFKGVVIDGEQRARMVSRYKTPSASSRYMWSSWMEHWHRFIELLPPVYDKVREGLYNRPDLQVGFFSERELLRQRLEGQLDWKTYIKSRKFAKKVIVMPSRYVFAISLLPKDAAKWLYSIKY